MKYAALGFTLVEIIVAIAIIAVLAALLFPVFGSARKGGQVRVCTSNLHQLGLSVHMYAADWDDRIPFAPDPMDKKTIGNSTTSRDSFVQLIASIPYDVRSPLAPYGTVPQLWRCPLDKFPTPPPLVQPTFFQECGSSYWYDDRHALTGWSLGDYTLPAQNVIMTDYYPSHLDDDVDSNCLNLLFADLHVKSSTWNERNALLGAQGD